MDLIERQEAKEKTCSMCRWEGTENCEECEHPIDDIPSAKTEDWMERNKERILQAGMEGREIEFRIGGRLFAIREKAQ